MTHDTLRPAETTPPPAPERLSNRTPLPDRTVAAGEILEGVQLCPPGDWTNAGKMQHCTEEALQRVCNRWQESGAPEILVDFEHLAEAGGVTGNCNAETPEAF